MSKGKISEAYKIVFRKAMDELEHFELEKVMKIRADSAKVVIAESFSISIKTSSSQISGGGNNVLTNIFTTIKTGSSELIDLYGNRLLRRRLLICHFTFFMSSLTYYVIGETQSAVLINESFSFSLYSIFKH